MDGYLLLGMEAAIVALSNGKGFDTKTFWKIEQLNLSKKFKYASSFQLADVTGDGKLDIIVRSSKGVMVATNTGSEFSKYECWSGGGSKRKEFSDTDAVCKSAIYSRTMQVVDVNADGKADLCSLCDSGIVVALSNGKSFHRRTIWKTKGFQDTMWRNSNYPIYFADVTGDGIPDIVARGKNGIIVAINTGSGFDECELWSSTNQKCKDFSLADTRIQTIKVADINGDGIADICAWGAKGAYVAFGSPNLHTFLPKTLWTVPDAYAIRGSVLFSVFFADINGDQRPDLIVRTNKGLEGGFAP